VVFDVTEVAAGVVVAVVALSAAAAAVVVVVVVAEGVERFDLKAILILLTSLRPRWGWSRWPSRPGAVCR
jgi:hypothetical protein